MNDRLKNHNNDIDEMTSNEQKLNINSKEKSNNKNTKLQKLIDNKNPQKNKASNGSSIDPENNIKNFNYNVEKKKHEKIIQLSNKISGKNEDLDYYLTFEIKEIISKNKKFNRSKLFNSMKIGINDSM